MDGLISLRRRSCIAVVAVFVVQQLLVQRTAAVDHLIPDNDIGKCIVFCASEKHAFTTNSAQELPHQSQRKHQPHCSCDNSESRILEQPDERLQQRKLDDQSPELVIDPPDDFVPTAVPTESNSVEGPVDTGGMDGIETTFSAHPTMAPIPSSPTTSPRPVAALTSAPIDGEPQLPTESPRPSATPVAQPSQLQLPTVSPRPTDFQMPSNSEPPSVSPKPIISTMPIQNPTTSTRSPQPVTAAPTRPLETESPTNVEKDANNDDYDGETNYNEPNTRNSPSPNAEVITPAKTNNENSNDSNLSGGGKFGIVLLVGIVLGVVGVGYMTIQGRLRHSYRGSYSSTYGMNTAETELGLWESNARHRRGQDDDDGLL